jgi:hypothetical protein
MKYLFTLSFLFTSVACFAQVLIENIKVDQFGYRPQDRKTAIIANPVAGFNASKKYEPGAEILLIVDANSREVAYRGNFSAWNNGQTHSQSGDKVWWFDFSEFTTPGYYFIYDSVNFVRSHVFQINENIYSQVLKQAIRFYFYQRCGMAKATPYADSKWQDDACHIHTNQDLNCRLVTKKANVDLEMNLSGGWHDAGDFNKYTNFTFATMHNLLFAYEENPQVFTDNLNIPESGNGHPDLLDEIKWELDWLLKMQLEDGSLLSKVAVTQHQAASPASDDTAHRYYGEASASATSTGCSIFAHAYLVFKNLNGSEMQDYATHLLNAANKAWNWLQANPGYSSYANEGFDSADPERNEYDQDRMRDVSALFMYLATGEASQKEYFEQNHDQFHALQWGYWYPFEKIYQDALLLYSQLPDADATIKNAIINSFVNSTTGGNEFYGAVLAQTDAYRAYLKDNDYVWGSNSVKSSAGNMIHALGTFDPANSEDYQMAALDHLHYFHGRNAFGLVMLTNMYDFGADRSANEMYHNWFGDGTEYDNALTSPKGPPPGFLTGGVNKSFQPAPEYSGPTLAPPLSQPVQKAYRDWNTSWPQNSWEITEPAIYYQAAYIRLLSKFASGTIMPVNDPVIAGINSHFHDQVKIFPNPGEEYISISFPGSDQKEIIIANIYGQNVLQQYLNSGDKINIQGLPSGVYFLQMNHQKGSIKFVKN